MFPFCFFFFFFFYIRDQTLKIVGASSDMIVVDLGSNPKKYKVGGQLQFNLDYLGLLKVMNSRYIEKKIHA